MGAAEAGERGLMGGEEGAPRVGGDAETSLSTPVGDASSASKAEADCPARLRFLDDLPIVPLPLWCCAVGEAAAARRGAGRAALQKIIVSE